MTTIENTTRVEYGKLESRLRCHAWLGAATACGDSTAGHDFSKDGLLHRLDVFTKLRRDYQCVACREVLECSNGKMTT